MRTIGEHEIEPIDLVCVNLYPFERTAAARGVDDAEVIENIDIGGPTLIRAAAKNHAFSAVVVSPESYDAVLDELESSDGRLSQQTRQALALDAFAYTARYDTAIARWFGEREEEFPSTYVRAFEKVLDLSYGENPHQRAAYYAQSGARTDLLSMVSKLHGKALSFNNLLDLDSGRRLVDEFEVPACAIIKHNNPCGCAVGGGVDEAFRKAFECDPMSAFGGVVVLQPQGRPLHGRAGQRDLRRAHLRPRLRRRRARDPRSRRRTSASSTTRSGATGRCRSTTSSACAAASSSSTATRTWRCATRCRWSPSASRASRSGASCCSRGRSRSTFARTRSCCRRSWPPSASARAR